MLIDAIAASDQIRGDSAFHDQLIKRPSTAPKPLSSFGHRQKAIVFGNLLGQHNEVGSKLVQPRFLQPTCDLEKL